MEVGRRILEASQGKVNALEERLAGTFKQVTPRQEFVRGLGRRIQTLTPAMIVDRFANLKLVLLVVAGVASFGILVVVGARALVSFFQKKPLSRA